MDLGEAADAVFKEFYNVAVSYAKGELQSQCGSIEEAQSAVFDETKKAFSFLIIKGILSVDELENAKKIFRIFLTKDKFKSLLISPISTSKAIGFYDWLGQIILPILENDCHRFEVIQVLLTLMELDNMLWNSSSSSSSNSSGGCDSLLLPPLPCNPSIIIPHLLPERGSTGLGIEPSGVELLKIICIHHRSSFLIQLARLVQDHSGLTACWQLGILEENDALEILCNRITNKSSKKIWLLQDEILATLTDCVRQREIENLLPLQILKILYLCDVNDLIPESCHNKRLDSFEEIPSYVKDRYRSIMDVCFAVLENNPSHTETLVFLLRRGFVEALDFVVQELVFRMKPSVISTTLLPFILNELNINTNTKSTQASNLIDADFTASLIDIILNVVERFYGSELQRQTAKDLSDRPEDNKNHENFNNIELGNLAFQCLLSLLEFEVGTHDTQRFPLLTASLLLSHIPESASWFLKALDTDAFQKSRRIKNLLDYIIVLALGIGEPDDPLSAVAEKSLHRLSFLQSIIALADKYILVPKLIIRVLQRSGDDRNRFVNENAIHFINMIPLLQKLINTQIQFSSEQEKSLHSSLHLIHYLLMSGTSIINDKSSSLFFSFLFDCVIITQSLIIHQPNNPTYQRLYESTDDALSQLVELLPSLSQTQLDLIISNTAIIGPLSACSLARMVPHFFINDLRIDVACVAFASLRNRPDLVLTFNNKLIISLQRHVSGANQLYGIERKEHNINDTEELRRKTRSLDLLIASAPILGQLASQQTDIESLSNALHLILLGCNISSDSNPQNQPFPIFLKALDEVSRDTDSILLNTFAKKHSNTASRLKVYLPSLFKSGRNGRLISKTDDDSIPISQQINSLNQAIHQRIEQSDPLGALRLTSQLRRSFPIQFEENNISLLIINTILPMIFKTLLPIAKTSSSNGILTNVYFNDDELNKYNDYTNLIRELLLLCPIEIRKYKLDIDKILYDLNSVIIQRFLENNDPSNALSFMTHHSIHEPLFSNAINTALQTQMLQSQRKAQGQEVSNNNIKQIDIYPNLSSAAPSAPNDDDTVPGSPKLYPVIPRNTSWNAYAPVTPPINLNNDSSKDSNTTTSSTFLPSLPVDSSRKLPAMYDISSLPSAPTSDFVNDNNEEKKEKVVSL